MNFEDIPPLKVKFDSYDCQWIEAMNSPFIRGIINHLAGLGDFYLEVGVFRGSSLVAAAHENECTCIGIDNFSEFNNNGSNELVARKRIESYPNAQILNASCWDALEVLKMTGLKVDTYMYDGSHDYDSQLRGLTAAMPMLNDDAYIIVDDVNWDSVSRANEDFCRGYGYESVFKKIAPYSHQPSDGSTDARHPRWWNGIEILRKNFCSRRTRYRQRNNV